MGAKNDASRDSAAWEMARRQHGVVSRAGLLGLGFSEKGIRHRVRKGRLHPIWPGVYAVGRRELSREGWWMAAVLASGAGAGLSHRSAGALWGIAGERGRLIDVTVCRSRAPRNRGIRAHCRQSSFRTRFGSHLGIPLTQPVQTLIDLATELPRNRLERAVNEADKLDLIDPDALRDALEDHAGERGVRRLRTLLDRPTFRLSDRELEVLFRPIAASAGLPVPETKVHVNGFEVDFFWPELGLVVETDGFRYHRTAATQSRDALRDQTHTAAGLTTLRFSHHQVKYEPDRVRRVLAATAARLPG
jgi:hypothetical protein